MPTPIEAYREGYERGRSDSAGGRLAEITMGMMRDDPGGHFRKGYSDGAADRPFSPPPIPGQVRRQTSGLIPKFSENPVGWFLGILIVVELWVLWQLIKAPFQLVGLLMRSERPSPWVIIKNVIVAGLAAALIWWVPHTNGVRVPGIPAPNQQAAIATPPGTRDAQVQEAPSGTGAVLRFGAIAYSLSTSRYGYSSNLMNRTDAENRAVSECQAPDCQARVWFSDRCGALATDASVPYAGWATDTSVSAASAAALEYCQKGAQHCTVLKAICSGVPVSSVAPSSPTSTLAATPAASAKTVVCEADVEMRQTFEIDLDHCELTRVPADTGADIWFEAETAERKFITPRNGALLHTLGKGKHRMPSVDELRQIVFDPQRIQFEDLAELHIMYVRTSEGHISLVRFTHLPQVSEVGAIGLHVLTWN